MNAKDPRMPGDGGSFPTITRRAFVNTGGTLFVSLSLPGTLLVSGCGRHAADAPDKLPAWLEIRSDNTVLVRTGRTETGTGMSGYYTQVIAEELSLPPEAVSLVMGDTDRTPDGGYSAGFLYGMSNVRKVAAYAYQALLGLAAPQLGVPATALTVAAGVISGGGKSITYGQLVNGQQLDLHIPVSGQAPKADPGAWVGMTSLDGFTVVGDPPLRPVSQFKVIGTSFPVPGIPGKVTGATQWSCDVTLPGMLHARMVRPASVGAALIAVGEIDRRQFPTAKVVRKENLVAVVSPDEWEAINAAQSVAATTRWTEWAGLPGSDNLTSTLRQHRWDAPSQKGHAAKVAAALGSASATISASYEQPYVRHAPIGPFLAVADVRSDGRTTVWTHSAHSQGLRARLAAILGVGLEKVVVRWLEHSGQYGRTTLGGDGAEADAVILSQLTGAPVRVQWTLQEDLAWSTASPGWVSDIEAAIAADGTIKAVRSAFYSLQMFDPRPLGALLARRPCSTSRPGFGIATEWPYDKVPERFEQVYAMPNLGAESPSGGLRGNIMRTPGQRQQNFVLECLLNEAAASAGVDPVEFRIRHTTDRRLIEILAATVKATSWWESRPAPGAGARRSGAEPGTGQGMCIIVRQNAYWVGIAKVAVFPDTGAVRVTHFTIGVDCGKIINPRQLDRCMKSGVVMGLSEALKEEVVFDAARVTSTDWSRYKILTMEEMPEIQVVQISRDDCGFGGGSEAANAVVPAAVAAAFFEATGVSARRIPLTTTYVRALLQSKPRHA